MPRYDPLEIEKKWQDYWENEEIYKFDKNAPGEIYAIDNPPSFTSGTLHMGHALNHSWIDFIARYRRMRGYNVLFPLGFDCHGLPTELKVERVYGISKHERDKFREKCEEWTTEAIAKMIEQYRRLGYSADMKNQYYETRMPWYKALVQYSLIEMFKKGLVYRSDHPVLWCPNCETALAKAEVGYVEKEGKLYYLKFDVEGGKEIRIATTRPELIFSCVAIMVNPKDERYKDLIGKKAQIPLANREVPILAEEDVDMEFGTGAVYLCTYGDEFDVKWQKKHSLPVYISIDPKGRMTDIAGEFAGMKAEEAREKVAEKLKELGVLYKEEKYIHNVLSHTERSTCMHPIELLPIPQFLIKVTPFLEDIKKAAREMKWFPDHMERRLEDWADAMDWDWIISRQRVYGTPIPFWVCKDCGEIIPASEDQLLEGKFVDPARDQPPVDKCPKCGSQNIEGSKDVCDCWVDSSITPLVVAHWKRDDELFERAYPNYLRPQGTDIIRTWAFYTIFRDLILTGKPPFKHVVVNGMVAGPDGKKMDKSHGNVVPPEEVIDKYGADALRQWALEASLGEDYPFDWKKITYANKFQTKLWNASYFMGKHLEDFDPSYKPDPSRLRPSDRWILARLNSVIAYSTEMLDKYEFGKALNAIRDFFWAEVCDNYLEMAKPRLYGEDEEEKATARWVLYQLLYKITLMLAPFIPHITEEIHDLYLKKFTNAKSVHLLKWPEVDEEFVDSGIEEEGKLVMAVASAVRGFKTQNQMSQKEELSKVIIYNAPQLKHWERDLKETLKIKELEFSEGVGSIAVEGTEATLAIEK